MAKRPVFLPNLNGDIGVTTKDVSFTWFAGFAKSQKQKSIDSLHEAAAQFGYSPILEISSKSLEEIGVLLSAFNLNITTRKFHTKFNVESAFQGSKVFENGGPYKDIIGKSAREAKKDERLKSSGRVLGFEFFGEEFPSLPRTAFYDWLYINALQQNEHLAKKLLSFSGFTDIEFNPEKSINCQAHSAALYVSLVNSGVDLDSLSSANNFLTLIKNSNTESISNGQRQQSLM